MVKLDVDTVENLIHVTFQKDKIDVEAILQTIREQGFEGKITAR